MDWGRFRRFIGQWPWLTAGLIYTLLSIIAIKYTRLDGGVSLVWLSNGFLVPWLALHPKRIWPHAIAVSLLGNAVPTILFGVGWGGLGLPILNLLECLFTVAVLQRWLGLGDYLDSTTGIAKFALIATLAPAIDAPFAAVVAHNALGVPYMSTAFNWFVGHTLGVILVAPMASLIMQSMNDNQGRHRRASPATSASWLAPVAGVSLLVFAQNSIPLLFLPLVPMMFATLRLGRFGAKWSGIILATIATVATHWHYGPMQLIGVSPVAQLQYLQFYLAATVVIVLPVAVMMHERRALTERLAVSESAFRLMAENSGDAMLHADAEGRIIQATGALEALLERDADWIIGRHASEIVVREDRGALIETHRQLLADPETTVDFEYRVRMRNGARKWFESRSRVLLDEDGQPVGTISAIRDIDARKRTESELQLAATTDQLTGLLNRRAFFSYFDLYNADGPAGIIIVADLDHFKSVNDRFGHHTGDAVLQRFARVAEGALRQADIVARIGGEEFAFYLPQASLDEGFALCERLRAALGTTEFDMGFDTPFTVTASLGMVAITTAETAAAALKRADTALYAAKEAGRDCLRLAA